MSTKIMTGTEKINKIKNNLKTTKMRSHIFKIEHLLYCLNLKYFEKIIVKIYF